MARKYTRDNRGRFASKGTGATARGGRLRTAAGNKRATQTMQAKGNRASTMAKPKGLKPDRNALVKAQTNQRLRARAAARAAAQAPAKRSGTATSGLRPGELMNANARPVNTMARFRKGDNPYVNGQAKLNYKISANNDDKKARLANAQTAKTFFESKGLRTKLASSRNSAEIASVNPLTKEVSINRSHTNWVNPRASAIRQRRSGFVSSSSPMHTAYHELGHARDKNIGNRVGPFGNMWVLGTRQAPSQSQREARGNEMQRLARRVSRYATTSPSEFIAETFAGLRTGRKYDYQVMRAYREAQGLSPTPAARRRRRKPR